MKTDDSDDEEAFEDGFEEASQVSQDCPAKDCEVPGEEAFEDDFEEPSLVSQDSPAKEFEVSKEEAFDDDLEEASMVSQGRPTKESEAETGAGVRDEGDDADFEDDFEPIDLEEDATEGSATAEAAIAASDVDIPDDEEPNEAATMLQSLQRRKQARKEVEAKREAQGGAASAVEVEPQPEAIEITDDDETNRAATMLQSIHRGRQARKEVDARRKDQGEGISGVEPQFDDIDIPDDEETNHAATMLQSIHRGKQARKEVDAIRKNQEEVVSVVEPQFEDIDIPDDEETHHAATMLQSIQRGKQARKEVEAKRKIQAEEAPVVEQQFRDIDIPDDAETNHAATMLQSIHRGKQARKEVEGKRKTQTEGTPLAEPQSEDVDIPDDEETNHAGPLAGADAQPEKAGNDCVGAPPAGYGTVYSKALLAPEGEDVYDSRFYFEGKEKTEEFETRIRGRALLRQDEFSSERDKFLDMMKEKGDGSVTVAWRRHFDSDGDGELDFMEFCNALADLKYEVDTVQLWHQFGGGLDTTSLTLEVLDPKGAEVIDFFTEWCKEAKGGPFEIFEALDENASDSLEPEELTEGLRAMGFFEIEGLPEGLNNEEKVLKNLYPLLDQGGMGCVQAEDMLFMEKDKEKKERQRCEIRRKRDFGTGPGAIIKQTDAEKFLTKVVMKETQLGGKFWKMIDSNNQMPSSPSHSRGASPSRPMSCKSSAAPSPSASPTRRKRIWSGGPAGGARTPAGLSASPAGSRTPKVPSFPSFCIGEAAQAAASDRSLREFASQVSTVSGGPSPVFSSPLVLSSFPSGMTSPLESVDMGGFSVPSGLLASPSSFPLESDPGDLVAPVKSRGLSSSVSLPQLTPKPSQSSRKRDRMVKNNSEIRLRGQRQMRDARSIYGRGLVTPLPTLNPKEPFVPAKASLIFSDTDSRRRQQAPQPGLENFNPRSSMPIDFFRSCKSQGLFAHYYQLNALEQ